MECEPHGESTGLPERDGGGTGSGPEIPTRLPVRVAVVFYALLGGAAVAWRLAADGVWPLAPAGAATRGALPPALALAAGGVVGLGVVAASRAWTRRSRGGARLARALAEALGPLSTTDVVLLAAVSGVAEEAFFRGALQPRVGWLAASLLFGLAHLAPRRELWVWAGFAVLAGGLFGALFEWSGTLLAPAAAHVVVNGLNVHWLVRDAARAAPAEAAGSSEG